LWLRNGKNLPRCFFQRLVPGVKYSSPSFHTHNNDGIPHNSQVQAPDDLFHVQVPCVPCDLFCSSPFFREVFPRLTTRLSTNPHQLLCEVSVTVLKKKISLGNFGSTTYVLFMFVMENTSVVITVVTDFPQRPWKNRLKIVKKHDFCALNQSKLWRTNSTSKNKTLVVVCWHREDQVIQYMFPGLMDNHDRAHTVSNSIDFLVTDSHDVSWWLVVTSKK
jgi:hypothetical protein